jgi:DNA polymerase-3 subunit alpha
MSVLDGIIKIPDLIDRVKDLGMESVAITDHGVATSSIQFYKEAKEKGVKPLIGMEAYLSPTEDHTLKEQLPNQPKQQCYHLTLLAKNAAGVSQLYELSSRGFLEGFYYKPRVSLSMVREIGKDLIVMGACAKGPISWNILQDDIDAANVWTKDLKESFGSNFYIELMDHGIEWQGPLNKTLKEISDLYQIPCIASNDAHFLNKEDHYIHSIMMCIQLKQTIDNLKMVYPESCYVKSPEEMKELFGEEPCRKTLEVAEQINIKLNLDEILFPKFNIEDRNK